MQVKLQVGLHVDAVFNLVKVCGREGEASRNFTGTKETWSSCAKKSRKRKLGDKDANYGNVLVCV